MAFLSRFIKQFAYSRGCVDDLADFIISSCDEFHYCPRFEFCLFNSIFHAATAESSGLALIASIIRIPHINY